MEPKGETEPRTDWIGPDTPSFGAVVLGSMLFMAGGLLIFTVIGIPFGLPLFAAGLGLMLEPKKPRPR
jgi:hypothetical protein